MFTADAAWRAEAKPSLKALYVAHAALHGERGRFTDDVEALGWTSQAQQPRDEIRVALTGEGRRGTATGVRERVGDRWMIDERHVLDHPGDVCAWRGWND